MLSSLGDGGKSLCGQCFDPSRCVLMSINVSLGTPGRQRLFFEVSEAWLPSIRTLKGQVHFSLTQFYKTFLQLIIASNCITKLTLEFLNFRVEL